MKNFYHRAYILIMIIAAITNKNQAQHFQVIDVNKSKDAYPANNNIWYPNNNSGASVYDWGHSDTYYAVLNGVSYFSADDGIHGTELWRSDGTDKGTYMIKDINPGTASSNVLDITISGGKIYFSAIDGVHVQEIWITDGTAQGTQPVIDMGPTGSFNPSYLTDVNGVLYFFTDQNAYGYYYLPASQLWRSDGTVGGTTMVADFYNNPSLNYSSQGRQITNVNGNVFFSILNYGYAPELGFSDGTTPGTLIINSINPSGNGSSPAYITSFNGLAYFSAFDPAGFHLWVSDGTVSGTHQINNANSIYLDNNTTAHFQSIGNALYFTGYSPDGDGPELWKYDASNSANNVELVKDINPGAFNNNMYNITKVGNKLFFSVYSGQDQTLWKSDGTTAGTMQVKDINPGGHNIYLYKSFLDANGKLLFSFYDDQNGYELWKSDGSSNGTTMIKEINPGDYSAWVNNISYLGNNVSLFNAYDGKNGFQLWRTDGTDHGTWVVKNINQTSTASSNPAWLTPSPNNQSIIFSAYDPEYGHELRITDGTDKGTHVIKNIYPGSFDSWPYLPANLKNTTYFFANIDNPVPRQDHGGDVFLVSRFWKTDGTGQGTSMISVPALEDLINNHGYVENPPSGPIATDNLLYLVIFNYTTNLQELWRSDGTSAGTYAIKTDISPYYNITPTAVDKNLFFVNYDINSGTLQLWVTDGSIVGTRAVPLNGAIYPQNLSSFKHKLYFSANDPVNYYADLWATDGSASGASMVKSLYIAQWVSFAQANGKLFFTADDVNTTSGYELWATDGSVQGTKLVRDIYPGDYNSSFPFQLTGANSLLFFTATDDTHGYELWKSDGSSQGTQLVKDITPGIDGSYGIYNLIAVKDQLYFLNYGLLWSSDGSASYTNAVNDANLTDVSSLGNLTAFGNKLCFTGYSYAYGWEMWAGNVTGCCGEISSISSLANNTEEIPGSAKIYPNPVNNILNVKLGSSGNSEASIDIVDVTGQTVIRKRGEPGQTLIQVNVANLPPGTYLLKVLSTNSTESVLKKFVKQ